MCQEAPERPEWHDGLPAPEPGFDLVAFLVGRLRGASRIDSALKTARVHVAACCRAHVVAGEVSFCNPEDPLRVRKALKAAKKIIRRSLRKD